MAKSSVFSKIKGKLNQAAKAHVGDAPKPRMGTPLPPGITNGIAQISEVVGGEYKTGTNKGQPFLRFTGIVIEPVEHAGSRTSKMIPMCDTKNGKGEATTFEEHVIEVQDEIEYLGLERPDDIEAAIEALNELKPLFKFSTSPKIDQKTKKPTGEAWENWHGCKGLENYVVKDADESVSDNTATDESEPEADATDENDAGDTNDTPEYDLDELLTKANAKKGGAFAQAKLKEIALSLGILEEDADGADSWNDLVDLIRAAEESGANGDPDEPEAETEAEWEPAVEEVCNAYLPDPKNPKKSKLVEVEIISINAKTQTAIVKDGSTGKTILGANKKPLPIALDKLSQAT